MFEYIQHRGVAGEASRSLNGPKLDWWECFLEALQVDSTLRFNEEINEPCYDWMIGKWDTFFLAIYCLEVGIPS